MGTKTNTDRLANYIKGLRIDRDWTQGQLAIKSGLTRAHISKLERGDIQSPGAECLMALAKAFSVPSDQILSAAGLMPYVEVTNEKLRSAMFSLQALEGLPDSYIEDAARLIRMVQEDAERTHPRRGKQGDQSA